MRRWRALGAGGPGGVAPAHPAACCVACAQVQTQRSPDLPLIPFALLTPAGPRSWRPRRTARRERSPPTAPALCRCGAMQTWRARWPSRPAASCRHLASTSRRSCPPRCCPSRVAARTAAPPAAAACGRQQRRRRWAPALHGRQCHTLRLRPREWGAPWRAAGRMGRGVQLARAAAAPRMLSASEAWLPATMYHAIYTTDCSSAVGILYSSQSNQPSCKNSTSIMHAAAAAAAARWRSVGAHTSGAPSALALCLGGSCSCSGSHQPPLSAVCTPAPA